MVPAADQSVMTIGKDDTLADGSLQVDYADPQRRLNSYIIDFPNVNQDMAKDELVWPEPDSDIDVGLKRIDGGASLSGRETIEGCNTRLHAASIASTIVLASRRPALSFTASPIAWLLEPGDVVIKEDEATGYRRPVRIVRNEITKELHCRISAREFNEQDYAWPGDRKEILTELEEDDSLGAPINPMLASAQSGYVVFTWEANPDEDAAVTNYEIQQSVDGERHGLAWRLLVPLCSRGSR